MMKYALIGLLAVGVCVGVGYYLEWRLARQRGATLRLARHPLGLFVLAAQRLRQARSWLRWLAGLWAVSLLLAVTWTPWLLEHYGMGSNVPRADREKVEARARDHKPMPETLTNEVIDGVQLVLREPGVHLDGAQSHIVGILVPVVLGIWLLFTWKLWASGRKVAFVPAVLLVLAGLLSSQSAFPLYHPHPNAVIIVPVVSGFCYLLLRCGFVAYTAIMCHLMLRTAQGEPTTLVAAAEHMRRVWVPLLAFSLINLALALLQVVIQVLGRTLGEAGGASHGMQTQVALLRAMGVLPQIVVLCLTFFTWIIMTHGPNFAYAWRRNFRLIGRNWRDIVVFWLRYTLIVQPVAFAINWHRAPLHLPGPSDPTAPWRDLAYSALVLIPAIAGVIWYLELDRTTPEAHGIAETPPEASDDSDFSDGAVVQ